MEVLFHKKPSLLYDLYRILVMKLNDRRKWIDRVANAGYEDDDVDYIERQLERFADPDSDLAVFFYLKNPIAKSYFSAVYDSVLREYGADIDIEKLKMYFQDGNQIRTEISRFYLETDGFDSANLKGQTEAIKVKAGLDGSIRFLVLAFLIQPQAFIEKLFKTLQQYAATLESIYEEQQKKIEKAQAKVKFQTLWADLKEAYGVRHKRFETVNISWSTVSKNAVHYVPESDWIILGYDYQQTLFNELNMRVDVEEFGNALGDRNRAKIIEYILAEGEQTSGEIAKKLGIALNTVSYHLEIMERANVLCARTKGKATHYWLNISHCQKAINMLNAWIRRSGRR